MHFKLSNLLRAGLQATLDEGDAAEKLKTGVLRGGSVGIYEPESKTFAGTCPRTAYLRMKGIRSSFENEAARHTAQLGAFDAGHLNEDGWMKHIEKVWKGKILREEEFPIQWKVQSSAGEMKGTGREDIILCDEEGKPQMLVELKNILSMWTARDVFANLPSLSYVIQTGNYMFRTGLPAKLMFSMRHHAIINDDWTRSMFPKIEEEGSQFCEYRSDGKLRKILPFFKVFDLKIEDDGFISVTCENTGHKTHTVVNLERIDNYYTFVANLRESDDLGPRPKNLFISGTANKGYTPCTYCDLKSTCDTFESKGKKVWEKAVVNLDKTGYVKENNLIIKEKTNETNNSSASEEVVSTKKSEYTPTTTSKIKRRR